MSVELKKCPFCAGDAYLTSSYSERTRRFYVFATCDNCGAQAKRCTCSNDPEKAGWNNEACKRAINAWNMRRNSRDDDTLPEYGEK